jgi:hypothetical protein
MIEKEKTYLQGKRYRQKNREKINARNAEYRRTHRERVTELELNRRKRRREEEPEKAQEIDRQNYQKNKEMHQQVAINSYQKNHEKRITYARKYRQEKKILTLLSSYRRGDRKAGLEYNLTEEWFKKNISGKVCSYCSSVDKVGCDRIDNDKGHTTDNCIPCCYECNLTRGRRYSSEEMKQLGIIIKSIKEQRLKSQIKKEGLND